MNLDAARFPALPHEDATAAPHFSGARLVAMDGPMWQAFVDSVYESGLAMTQLPVKSNVPVYGIRPSDEMLAHLERFQQQPSE